MAGVSSSLAVLWDEAMSAYDFGPTHPMQPVRLELSIALARSLGVLDAPGVGVRAAPGASEATDELLTLVHTGAYIEAVKAAQPDERHGLGTSDVPVFPGMHDASAHIVEGTVEAARLVLTGEAEHAVNLSGGLHHAMAGNASGFCVYNDVAVAIAWLLAHGVERVAYVDVDVHHGDGVQAAFYADPRVLTVSVHETGQALFPGTGFADDIGEGAGAGYAVNLALPPGTGDGAWLRAFHAVVPPLVRAFGPQVIVSQHGCDSHALDPLADLALSVDGQRASYAALHDLAHEVAGGAWVAVGGGGYDVVQVVPRAWAHLLAEMAGRPLDGSAPTPQAWRDLVRERTGRVAPELMGDGGDVAYRPWESGYDPGNAVDRAVMATRKAVFPLHGLEPF